MKKYLIIAAVLTVVVLLFIFRDKIKALFTRSTGNTPPPPNGSGNTTPAPAPQPAALDYNKILRRGVNGAETRQLQAWLGVATDGIFGPITESALIDRKGVESISLNGFQTMPDVSESTDTQNGGLAWLSDFWDVFSDEPTVTGGSW